MRRSLAYIQRKAEDWQDLAASLTVNSELSEGQQAYAFKHAGAYLKLHKKWRELWQPLVDEAKKTRFGLDVKGLGSVTGTSGSSTGRKA